MLEVNFQADDGKVELEFSIYELERRDEIIRAAAEHAASFQIVGPPRRSAHADFVGSGTCQVKPANPQLRIRPGRSSEHQVRFRGGLTGRVGGAFCERADFTKLSHATSVDTYELKETCGTPSGLRSSQRAGRMGSSLLARRRRRPQRPAPSEVGEPKEKLKSMHYVRPFPASEPVAPVELTDEEFEAIRIARQGVLRVLGVEEKFDIRLANHPEL